MSNFFVGKVIKDILIAKDDLALKFICDDGEHIVTVDADCCSFTWIESVETPALGLPAKVISQRDLDLNKEPLENDEYECLQFYGYEITTDKGVITIDYRNESNGYYGGDICMPDASYRYEGVYNQACSKNEWVEL